MAEIVVDIDDELFDDLKKCSFKIKSCIEDLIQNFPGKVLKNQKGLIEC